MICIIDEIFEIYIHFFILRDEGENMEPSVEMEQLCSFNIAMKDGHGFGKTLDEQSCAILTGGITPLWARKRERSWEGRRWLSHTLGEAYINLQSVSPEPGSSLFSICSIAV